METTRIKLHSAYKELFNESWRHIVYHGGRASGKSTAVAYSLLLRGRQKKLRILATREIQNSIADSVHKLLSDIINRHGFTDYEVQRETIRNKVTGTEFLFKGLKKDSQAIKSLEGVDICWVEEAQTIAKSSIAILIPTIRKQGSQLIWTFNRTTELDPVFVEIVMNKDEKTFVAHVNSDVLEEIGQLPQTVIDEREKMRKNEPALFPHVWLGEPIGQADMAILSRDSVLEAMQREIEPDGTVEIGADIARLGNDRIVFWKRKGLKTVETKTLNKLRTTETCDALEQFAGFDKSVLIKVDDTGVGGGVTDEMIKRGYNIRAINFGETASDPDKYPNWISEAWFHMQAVLPDAQLPMDSDLLMELTTRQWFQDTKGKRRVESKSEYKKRGFRSPDLADACIICYHTPAVPTIEWGGVR